MVCSCVRVCVCRLATLHSYFSVHVSVFHAIEIVIISKFNREESSALENIKSSLKIECMRSQVVHRNAKTRKLYLCLIQFRRIHFAAVESRSHLVAPKCCASSYLFVHWLFHARGKCDRFGRLCIVVSKLNL